MQQNLASFTQTKASQRLNPMAQSSKNHDLVFKRRLRVLSFLSVILFALLFGRLVMFGFDEYLTIADETSIEAVHVDINPLAKTLINQPRPDIVDRNGVMLATDLTVESLSVNPRKVADVEATIDKLRLVFPDLNWLQIRRRLNSNAKYAQIAREISPEQKQQVIDLAIIGTYFEKELKRDYPNGNLTSHVLGYVNIDHEGQAGLEYFANFAKPKKIANYKQDDAGKIYQPLVSSIDARVQYVVYDELGAAIEKFDAIGGMAVVMDIYSGEVISMVSLPDYNPNIYGDANKADRLNRINGGVYELGSIYKLLSSGMGLDYGVTTMEGGYDATSPLPSTRGKFISDFHGKKRYLTVPEIFKYSSNIGTALMALDVGAERQQAFLRKLNLLDKLQTEIPGAGKPQYPLKKNWKRVSTMTISFGHGIAVTPLQMIAASGAMMNGGFYIKPTFLKRSAAEASALKQQVIKPETSRDLVSLMRLNVLEGSGKTANVNGYMVGGKTGTADKPIKGGYSKEKLLASFLSVFPTDKPQYMMLVSIDEPKGLEEDQGFNTAGWNVVPTSGKIIERIAPLLGLAPRYDSRKIDGSDVLDVNHN
ncbi:MAG: penicillin-binding protein 2 [Rhizobiales bacterium]|nr:penicillin-binding protein 2 [Hyphomicrobiales bacterium]NRB14001.1 penicillin-binding protein 2 [Hyphomicrobiales bacterium]